MSIGILTPQQGTSYPDLLQLWRDADSVPQIEHAWLFDHLLAIGGDPSEPVLEGWTALAALAAETERLRLGLLVSSNRFRPPAHLAKIATTIDVVSGGRLEFGIGVGSRSHPPEARREYPAHGLSFVNFAHAVAGLDEACEIVARLWTESRPFDFAGSEYQLRGAFGSPKPLQTPRPPMTIAGRSDATLRVVARHADIWNIPGGDMADCIERNTRLDEFCEAIDRDPGSLVRSIVVPLTTERPDDTWRAVAAARDGGFTRLIFGLPTPFHPTVLDLVAEMTDVST